HKINHSDCWGERTCYEWTIVPLAQLDLILPAAPPPFGQLIFFLLSSSSVACARASNPRLGMSGSSQSFTSSSSATMLVRDADGSLPLSKCSLCGTRLIGRVSQQPRSKGKRFYKCPRLEHTDLACKFYMLEEHYVEYLATYGLDGPPIAMHTGNCSQGGHVCTDVLREANVLLKEARDAMERCNMQLESATHALKEA
ncbi:unnamed protein product, partial [Urochloa humidicola]